jgi:Clr5 domain
MEAVGEDEYWMPEFMGDDDDWVSQYLQGRGASLDLGNMTTAEGQLQIEPEFHDISEQSVFPSNVPDTEVPSINPPTASLGVEHRRSSLSQQARARIPFSRRWELVKPAIERLYVDENIHLSDIIKIMKEQHDFDAK